MLIRIHDEGFHLRYLWTPHTHARPLTYWAATLLNAQLTDWDIRSEYVYLYASFYAAFLLQAFALWRICGKRFNLQFLSLCSALSVFSFSPVAHNTHWWSLMIMLSFTHFFVICALLALMFDPERWRNQVLAAVACWLALYSVTNGLVAFVVVAIVSQLVEQQPLRITTRTLFWVANVGLALAIYMPGMPATEVANKPGPLALLWFFFVYLGAPLFGLLRFPYTSMFELPRATLANGLTGVVLCGVAVLLTLRQWKQIRARKASSLLFLGCVLFSMGSALLTGWGRAAFDSYGVANANSSRYTIFSSYLLYGLLYVAAGAFYADRKLAPKTSLARFSGVLACAGLAVLLLSASHSYARSVAVYRGAHDFNQVLANAYGSPHTASDPYVYPNPQVVADLKSGLRRLRIGPYRFEQRQPTGPLLEELAQNSLEDTFHINGLRVDSVLGTILFAHPHSRFSLSVSSRTKAVSFEYGILDGAWKANPPMDGVGFRIWLRSPGGDSTSLWSAWLRPLTLPSDRGPHQATVPLQASDGSSIIFETLPGQRFENNWAYWTKLEISGAR